MKKINDGSVVYYNGQFFILWNTTVLDKAQLITPEGRKFSGTPNTSKLEFIKELPIVEYNRSKYAIDKYNRIFSMSTGNLVYTTNCPERARILDEVGRA